ncbi:MAG: ATPase, partial [Lachnospiraceae bacterium]|nr:ATPase [Lachnospiraceae bacterium]
DMNIDSVKSKYNDALKAVKEDCAQVSAELKNLFDFSEKAFEDGNEMLILVTELTVNKYASRFIARFGSDEYTKHNKELMLSERQGDLDKEIQELLEF